MRKAAGLSQAQVAKELGLSQPTIVMIENGRNKVISTDIANKLARLYNCDVRTIINCESRYSENKKITNCNVIDDNCEEIQKIS